MALNQFQFSLNAFLWSAFAISVAVGTVSLNIAEYGTGPEHYGDLQVFSKFLVRWIILGSLSGVVALCADKKKPAEREIRVIAFAFTILAGAACLANYVIGTIHLM